MEPDYDCDECGGLSCFESYDEDVAMDDGRIVCLYACKHCGIIISDDE